MKIKGMQENPIYERQEGETDKAYAAFCIYRDMGPGRSIERAFENRKQTGGKRDSNTTHWNDWSSKYNWVARAAAYDDYIERKYRERREAQLLRIQDKALSRLEKILDTQVDDTTDFDGFMLQVKEYSEMPEHAKAAIKKIKFQKGQGTEIELYDALGAIRDALKLTLLRVEKSEVTGKDGKDLIPEQKQSFDFSGLTLEEKKILLKAMKREQKNEE